jgi:hypothetical protein
MQTPMTDRLNLITFGLLGLFLIILSLSLNFIANETSYCPFDQFGAPTPSLHALLNYFKIHHTGTLESIVSETQKAWLRQPGKERWELEDTDSFNNDRAHVLELFDQVGTISEKMPKTNNYNYLILLGGLTERIRIRFAYLVQQWNKGIRFDTIIVLSGTRPLDQNVENGSMLLNSENGILPFDSDWKFDGILPTTEIDMIRFIYQQAALPAELRAIPIHYISAPMVQNQRPTTADTINTWLKTSPAPGRILAISSQPYVLYQESVLKTLLPKDFKVDAAGPKAPDSIKISDLCDNTARLLYQEYHRLAPTIHETVRA